MRWWAYLNTHKLKCMIDARNEDIKIHASFEASCVALCWRPVLRVGFLRLCRGCSYAILSPCCATYRVATPVCRNGLHRRKHSWPVFCSCYACVRLQRRDVSTTLLSSCDVVYRSAGCHWRRLHKLEPSKCVTDYMHPQFTYKTLLINTARAVFSQNNWEILKRYVLLIPSS